jgi:hypothetical protein
MTDKTDVFLTDKRTDVLNREYEGSESVRRTHESRIRQRARTAISELIEVADSPVIDNADVFEPEEVGRLLAAILSDPSQMPTAGGLIVEDAEESEAPDDVVTEMPESLRQYRQRVAGEASRPILDALQPDGPD